MSSDFQYLIRLLQVEIAQSQAEVLSIRSSLRYRAGSLLLETFPPSRRSFSALHSLLRLFFIHARGSQAKRNSAMITVSEAALVADVLVFAPSAIEPLQGETWVTSNAAQLAAVMDAVQSPRTLLLQQLDQTVLRRLARWQILGGVVQWQPLPNYEYCPVLLGYLQSLLDKPVDRHL